MKKCAVLEDAIEMLRKEHRKGFHAAMMITVKVGEHDEDTDLHTVEFGILIHPDATGLPEIEALKATVDELFPDKVRDDTIH